MKQTLQTLRQKLDRIDENLLKLLAQRMTIVEQIGKMKKEEEIPPLDQKRWGEVLLSRKKIGKQLGLPEKFIESIWDAIHKEALEREKNT